MAATCGLVVANNYYNQPLLAEFAQHFSVPDRSAGQVSILTQMGYALGMLFLLPMGDMIERRKLILAMLCLSIVALIATATAPNIQWLKISSFAIGFTSIVPQLTIPFAAHLTAPSERGKVVGTLMGGLLTGILLSRTFSGLIADRFGWRAVYWAAAVIMVALIVVLSRTLPRNEPNYTGTYGNLMKSLGTIIRQQPVLREMAILGFLFFGLFSAFWTTLSFYLASPVYHYSAWVAGMFGILGVTGALAAPVAGRLADKKGPTLAIVVCNFIVLAAFLEMLTLGHHLWGLIFGVILLDLGNQAAHISSQTNIYTLKTEALSRLNTVYMVSRFFGGVLGSTLGNYAWSLWRWPGVCGVGITLTLVALLVQFYYARNARALRQQPQTPA